MYTKHQVRIFIFQVFMVITLVYSSNYTSSQTPANDPHWQPLWSDEFNSGFLDPAKWEVLDNFDQYGCAPNVFLNDNNYVFFKNDISNPSNKILVLHLEKHDYDPIPTYYTIPPNINPSDWWYCHKSHYSYISGYIQTIDGFDTPYGYIEARIKLPDREGINAAFWTVSNPYREIDIFEFIPGIQEECNRNKNDFFNHNKFNNSSNIHLLLDSKECSGMYDYPSVFGSFDYTQWHTYGIEWSPTRIIWYVDNYPVRYYKNSQITIPSRILFDLALINADQFDTYNTSVPADMEIDYFRSYILNEDDCDEYINTVNYDFFSYDYLLKNYISIGADGGVNSIQPGENVILRASQYIEINGNFNVPLGASLYMDANGQCGTTISDECSLVFNPCSFDFSNYNNSVKKSIELGGNGCNITILPTNNLLFEATDKISLKPGVRITSNSGNSVKLKISPCH